MTIQNRAGIQRLPLELISENILLFYLPDETFQTPQQDQAPLPSHSINGQLNVPTVNIPLMEVWLPRSLNHPLAISLELDLEDSALEFLSRHLPRTLYLHTGMVSRFGLEDATTFKSAPLLTRLTMELFSYSEVLNALAQYTDIKYLKLSTMKSPTRLTQHIILPELSTLVTSRYLDPLFDSLTLPKLSILECVISSFYNDWPRLSFQKFYKRSQFSLSILKLRYFNVRESGLKTLLTDFGSNLTELTCISDYLLDHLRPNPLIPAICPKLNTINLFNCIPVRYGTLTAMVRSRLANEDEAEADPKFREAGLAHLQMVRVSDDVEVEELLDMRERGLVIEV